MEISTKKLLLSELRMYPILGEYSEITDENMVKAITINEELKNLGYTLRPTNIVKLAKYININTFLNDFTVCMGDVKAKPMYPNFPTQVLDMDEATFRFHQLLHYFSTYGMEMLTGENVSTGWLPNVEDTEKIKADDTLINAKIIELFVCKESFDDAYEYAYTAILSKRERMTDKEREIVKDCLRVLPNNKITSIFIPFKQNMLDVFYTIFNSSFTNECKLELLQNICVHTGDVFKCADYCLTRCNYHFKTSQKRLLTHLLEQYPIYDFTENLIISNKKAQRTELILRYLDCNNYFTKVEFKSAVASLRDSQRRSWQSKILKDIKERTKSDKDILYMVAIRPGMAIRMITFLLRNKFDANDIYEALKPKADKLSTQTLITLCTKFGEFCYLSPEDENFNKLEEMTSVYSICYRLLKDKFESTSTILKDKKVYINLDEYNLEHSKILTNEKSSEGGYIRSGLAYNIPENTNTIRYFVYWNDKARVDVDLHSSVITTKGEEAHFGWNCNYAGEGLVFSGDITHSNAAEYIDIDLNKAEDIDKVFTNINVYTISDSRPNTFKNIEECYVGCMAVHKTGEEVKLYNPKNCFFTHFLKGDYQTINYGFIDIPNRCIVFDGKSNTGYYSSQVHRYTAFSLETFINTLCITQNVERVNTAEEADYILIMAKPQNDKEISLIDNNFFMDI